MPEVLLGDYTPKTYEFPHLGTRLAELLANHSSYFERFTLISQELTSLILQAPVNTFLLPAVTQFLSTINTCSYLDTPLTFSRYEFWLNHYSPLDEATRRDIRNRISGKWLPRYAYQALFPIGNGKQFSGSHLVTAHLSPDADTTVASFWSWLDAFACQVGTALHLWSLPPGAEQLPIANLFRKYFNPHIFATIPRNAATLTLSAMDLVTQENLERYTKEISINTLDHGINERAIILVDENGYYLGDWRSSDVELVRQVVIVFKACLRWLENNFHTRLISLFASPELHKDHLSAFFHQAFSITFAECEVTSEFSETQKARLERFLKKVLGLHKGLLSSFSELNHALDQKQVSALLTFETDMRNLSEQQFFDATGHFIENRPALFAFIEHTVQQLTKAMHQIRDYSERLDISIQIKEAVLQLESPTITLETSLEMILAQMTHYDYLVAVFPEKNGKQFPAGAVWANSLRRHPLGTVSLRDFSNEQETKLSSYLSVISVIDHHKMQITTTTPPLAILSDAQACNVLMAEQAIAMNDAYRTQRGFSIAPEREFLEYLFFLHAILDDTDLLTKVTARDVLCIKELLNRLKSIQRKDSHPIIELNDLASHTEFAKEAAQRILNNPDMRSLYEKSFAYREQEISRQLTACVQSGDSALFADTKTQNQCCRVGQIKLFHENRRFFASHRETIAHLWVIQAMSYQQNHPELDLHIEMISTIAAAGGGERDELWFWIPSTDAALNHLRTFLNQFRSAQELKNNELSLEVTGAMGDMLAAIFKEQFVPMAKITKREARKDHEKPPAILQFTAGSLNSRKAMISPYLPRLVS